MSANRMPEKETCVTKMRRNREIRVRMRMESGSLKCGLRDGGAPCNSRFPPKDELIDSCQ